LGHETKGHIVNVAVYGKHNGKSKRWELTGTEEQVKKALPLAVEHPPKERFTHNPFPNIVLGDHDQNILKIDFDERYSCPQVKRICYMLLKRYLLEGFIILQSSTKTHKVKDEELEKDVFKYQTKSYHAVFNRPVTMIEINRILAWLCLRLKDDNLTKWFFMQLQKGTYTLRIAFKGKKKPPRIVYRYGNQDKQIARYLANREFILDFLKEAESKSFSLENSQTLKH
jgi:hypothetical protein